MASKKKNNNRHTIIPTSSHSGNPCPYHPVYPGQPFPPGGHPYQYSTSTNAPVKKAKKTKSIKPIPALSGVFPIPFFEPKEPWKNMSKRINKTHEMETCIACMEELKEQESLLKDSEDATYILNPFVEPDDSTLEIQETLYGGDFKKVIITKKSLTKVPLKHHNKHFLKQYTVVWIYDRVVKIRQKTSKKIKMKYTSRVLIVE